MDPRGLNLYLQALFFLGKQEASGLWFDVVMGTYTYLAEHLLLKLPLIPKLM